MGIILRYFDFDSDKEFYNWDVEVPDGTDISELCKQLGTECIARYDRADRQVVGDWMTEGTIEDGCTYSVFGPDVKYKHQLQAWIRKFKKFEFRSGD